MLAAVAVTETFAGLPAAPDEQRAAAKGGPHAALLQAAASLIRPSAFIAACTAGRAATRAMKARSFA